MMHRLKYSKSLVDQSGRTGTTTVLLLLKSQRLVVSNVGGTVYSSAAMGNTRRFFNTGVVVATESSSSSSQLKREPTKQFQTERFDDEISSTKVSLNQFPGLMTHGMDRDSKTRRLLRINPDTGYFEEREQDVAAAAAAAANHHNILQVPSRYICRGSAYGWLFLSDDDFDTDEKKDEDFDLKLFNPFSGAEIQLPPLQTLPFEKDYKEEPWDLSKWFVEKAVFSANPSIEPRPVVLVIYRGEDTPSPRLAFCKPGDKGWTPLEFPKISYLMDAIFHEGQFYVLGWPGYVAAFDIGRRINDEDHSVKMVAVVENAPKRRVYMRDCYLVVLDGELVRFDRKSACMCMSCIKNSMEKKRRRRKRDGDTTDDEDCCFVDYSHEDFLYEGRDEKRDDMVHVGYVNDQLPMITYEIKIHRFDASEKKWVKVKSLGDKAVFLGFNTSFALSASDYPAGVCIPDSVYFTYGVGGDEFTDPLRCYDTGIYNVKNKTIKRLVKDDKTRFVKPVPIWIVNSADR